MAIVPTVTAQKAGFNASFERKIAPKIINAGGQNQWLIH